MSSWILGAPWLFSSGWYRIVLGVYARSWFGDEGLLFFWFGDEGETFSNSGAVLTVVFLLWRRFFVSMEFLGFS